jgi:adenine-specific DNA-methyltransferase
MSRIGCFSIEGIEMSKEVRTLKIHSRYNDLNRITLFHGNCLDLLKQMPDSAAQLIVTSPPYNVGKEYERKSLFDQYILLQRSVIQECVRVLKPGGSLCWQVGHHVNGHGQVIPLDLFLHNIFMEYEGANQLRLRNRIIWCFDHGLHCQQRFSGRHESILWYSKGDQYFFNLNAVRVPQKYPGKRAYQGPRKGSFSSNPLGKNPGDVWIFPNVKSNHVEKTKHPCQFPIELPERLILALTKSGDLVVDPFIGSGTTAVAAIIRGRRVVGADLRADYLNIARNRIKMAVQGTVPYRALGTPVHVPLPNSALTTPPKGFASHLMLANNSAGGFRPNGV